MNSIQLERHAQPAEQKYFLLVAGLMCLLIAGPYVGAKWPALADYPNHLARLAILTGKAAPGWQANYDIAFSWIPNLGLELVARGLVNAGMEPRTALNVFALLSQLLMFTGAGAISWALHRRTPWLCLLAAPMAYNRYFVWGFLNYIFALGVGLWCVAAWLLIRRSTEPVRLMVGAAALGFLLTFCLACHLMGLGVALAAIWSYEMTRWVWLKDAPPRARLIALCVTTLIPLTIYALAFDRSQGFDYYFSGVLRSKASGLISPFLSYASWIALLEAAGFIGCVLWAVRQVSHETTPGWWINIPFLAPAACMLILFLLLPQGMMNSDFLDKRLFVAVLLLLLAFMPVLNWRTSTLSAWVCVVVALTALKTAENAHAWQINSTEVDAVRQDLDRLPVAAHLDGYVYNPSQVLEFPPLRHVSALATMDRGALVPDFFARPRYVSPIRFKDTQQYEQLDKVIQSTDHPETDLAALCGHFSHVLVTYQDAAPPAPPCLTVMSQGHHHTLYRSTAPTLAAR